MKFSKRVAIGTLAVVLVSAALGFLLIYPGGRRIAGDFRLVREADNVSYKLDDTAQSENQLGNSGAVVRIGWDKHSILVKRVASPTRGTPWSNEAGWVVIELDRSKAPATVTDAQIRERQDLSTIVTYSPDSAYAAGHWW